MDIFGITLWLAAVTCIFVAKRLHIVVRARLGQGHWFVSLAAVVSVVLLLLWPATAVLFMRDGIASVAGWVGMSAYLLLSAAVVLAVGPRADGRPILKRFEAQTRATRSAATGGNLLQVFAALAIGTGMVTVTPAPARASGIPVVDVANLQQQIMQYTQMIEQLRQMEAQLSQAKAQYEAMTGGRDMENLLRDVRYDQVPSNWQETLAMMEGGGQVGSLARSIREDTRRIDIDLLDTMDESLRTTTMDFGDSAAMEQAVAAVAYDSAANRVQRLQSLMDAIPSATDVKAIGDLQARIQVEQAVLQNEVVRMQAFASLTDAQRAIEAQQVRESLLRANSGTEVLPPAPSWVRDR